MKEPKVGDSVIWLKSASRDGMFGTMPKVGMKGRIEAVYQWPGEMPPNYMMHIRFAGEDDYRSCGVWRIRQGLLKLVGCDITEVPL